MGPAKPLFPKSWVWTFTKLFAFQIFTALFFALNVFVALIVESASMPFHPITLLLFGAASISLILLVAFPHDYSARLMATFLPVLAAGARFIQLVWRIPPAWAGVLLWAWFMFVIAYASPRFMPPPLRNGQRRQWLRERHHGTVA